MIAEDQDKSRVQDEEETEANGDEEASHTPARRGWVRRSVASSGTHHSTELIEVQVPDHPAITMDCCVQVMEQSSHYTIIFISLHKHQQFSDIFKIACVENCRSLISKSKAVSLDLV